MKVVGALTAQSGIYCIRNTVNGKVYIGSAVDLLKRLRAHRLLLAAGRHHSTKLQRAWQKHGAAAFECEVIEAVADTAALLRREQHWIVLFDAATQRYGYNINPTAGSNLGRKFGPHTPEHGAKIAASNRRRKLSPETRAKIGAANRGQKRPGVTFSPLARARSLMFRRGRPLSDEHRNKLAERMRGRIFTAEHRANHLAAARRRWSSADADRQRAVLAQSRRAAWAAGRYDSKRTSLTAGYPQSYSVGLSKS